MRITLRNLISIQTFLSVATDYYSQTCKNDSELGAVIGGVVAVVIIVSIAVIIVITVVMLLRSHRGHYSTAGIELKYVCDILPSTAL